MLLLQYQILLKHPSCLLDLWIKCYLGLWLTITCLLFIHCLRKLQIYIKLIYKPLTFIPIACFFPHLNNMLNSINSLKITRYNTNLRSTKNFSHAKQIMLIRRWIISVEFIPRQSFLHLVMVNENERYQFVTYWTPWLPRWFSIPVCAYLPSSQSQSVCFSIITYLLSRWIALCC